MIDLTRLNELASDDNDLAIALVSMWQNQAPEFIDNLKIAIQNQNGQDIKVQAHTFKGVCLNLGLDEVAIACKELEVIGLDEDFVQAEEKLAKLNNIYLKTSEALSNFITTL